MSRDLRASSTSPASTADGRTAPRTPGPLPAGSLRWRCDPASLPFAHTGEVEPVAGVVGQDAAVDSLRFGLEIDAPGQNVFVRGLAGTGRLTLVRRLLESIQPHCPLAADRLYVHAFSHPERPRLLCLPRGRALPFQRAVDALVEFVAEDLTTALGSQLVRARRAEIDERFRAEAERHTRPFDEELHAAGLGLLTVQTGHTVMPTIAPLVDGQPVSPEQLGELRRQGKVSDEQLEQIEPRLRSSRRRLEEVAAELEQLRARQQQENDALLQAEARRLLQQRTAEIASRFPGEGVLAFLQELVEDVVTRRLPALRAEDVAFTARYRVNVVLGQVDDEPCPVVVENVPGYERLVGTVEQARDDEGAPLPPHMGIRAGSLLRADGGYLVLETRDVLADEAAWTALVRTLRSGLLEIVPPELPAAQAPAVRPEPIRVNVKVVLLGDEHTYAVLSGLDPDFPHLFKVLADFEDTIPRDAEGLRLYAGVLARIAREEGLPRFGADAVAALAEHGARIASAGGRLTARFGRVADLAREAAWLAGKDARDLVTGDDVREAVRRSKRRGDLPSRRFRRLVADGTIRVRTRGSAVGEANGLAVISAGPLTYGFPTRITATVGPGTAGAVNIEREADLSGAIHTKGFYILGGLLRRLLRADHPLAFDGSVAFEQSYGGIDGDSASGVEICCLLSALTDAPIRQDLAMTGAIDQVGNVLPIGAVNEKVEGFFDTCVATELTGTQGVIVPAGNVADLMLRHDVVDACRQGRFTVYAVETIQQALALLTGLDPGERQGAGDRYPDDTLLGIAVRRARRFWELSAAPVRREEA